MTKYPLRVATQVVKTGRALADRGKAARAGYMMARGGGKEAMRDALDKVAKTKGFDFNSSVLLDFVSPQRVSDAARDFGSKGPRSKRKA